MQLRPLGQSSMQISSLMLGTWAIGGWMWGGTNEKSAIEAIEASMDQGMNAIDTAPIYGMGLSEQIVAKAIKGKRDKVLIATKCGLRWDTEEGSHPYRSENYDGKVYTIRRLLSPSSIFQECDASLKRLNIDCIDLYQIHWPDESTQIEDSWNTLVQLKKLGKVRAIGVSNFNLQQLKSAHQLHPVDSIQMPYSLIRRGLEADIIPFCKANKISILAYSPLERGLLSGKYSSQAQFVKGDHRSEKTLFSSVSALQVHTVLSIIKPIADKYKATTSQLIIRCTIDQSGITSAIAGARNAFQAIENAQATQLPITEKERLFVVNALSLSTIQHPLYD